VGHSTSSPSSLTGEYRWADSTSTHLHRRLRTSHPEAKRRFEQADKRAYAKANRRVEIVRAYICGNPLPANENIPVRTLRYWAAQYRLAEEAYGNGYIGLLPQQRKGNAKSKLPPHLGVLHTPDFFVLRARSAGWEECKTEEELIKLAAKNPNRYYKDGEDIWRCPPGEAYAAEFGFYYRVRSSSEISWTFQRNVEFLEDYFRNDSQVVTAETHALLHEQVAAEPGISLRELFERTEGIATRDDVFTLIAIDSLYVNLTEVPMVETERVCVFPNRDIAIAHANLVQTSTQIRSAVPHFVDLSVGTYIKWDQSRWRIVNVGATVIGLMGEGQSFTEVPVTAFEKLVQENRITGIATEALSGLHPEVKRLFEQADRCAYSEANRRYEIVLAYINGDPMPLGENVSERTKRRWKAQYLVAQERYGIGYVGLLPHKNGGNKKEKLPPATLALLDEFIKDHYETFKQKRKFEAYASFQLACAQRGVIPASYKTFTKAVRRRSRHAQTSSRQGPKAAYKYEEFYWELTPTTPRHGETFSYCPY
jgi:putative transposase